MRGTPICPYILSAISSSVKFLRRWRLFIATPTICTSTDPRANASSVYLQVYTHHGGRPLIGGIIHTFSPYMVIIFSSIFTHINIIVCPITKEASTDGALHLPCQCFNRWLGIVPGPVPSNIRGFCKKKNDPHGLRRTGLGYSSSCMAYSVWKDPPISWPLLKSTPPPPAKPMLFKKILVFSRRTLILCKLQSYLVL